MSNKARCEICNRNDFDLLISIPVLNEAGDKVHELGMCRNCAEIFIRSYFETFSQDLLGVHRVKNKAQLIDKICLGLEPPSNATAKKHYKYFAPKTIEEKLNEYVIGQSHAKKVLSTAIYNHYKILEQAKNSTDDKVEIEKSNILLCGSTGSGKTYTLKRIAKILNVPIAIGDATSLTAAGFVGSDVETILKQLIDNAGGDIELASKGIVYIDEIDKLSRKSDSPNITSDPSHEAVQQSLLKMIEGSIVEVPVDGVRKHPDKPVYKIDTTNILFIVGGSFEGIEKIIGERLKNENTNSKFGFGGTLEDQKDFNDIKIFNDTIKQITVDDLKNFGMIPEFLGRLPIICPMEELTEDELLDILTKPKNALVKQYQELFKMDNVELEFTEEALKEVAREAIKRKTGARSLRGILEKYMNHYMYIIPDSDIKKITITENVIKDNEEAIIEYKNESKENNVNKEDKRSA